MEFGSIWCDFQYYKTIATDEIREKLRRRTSFIEPMIRYARTDWLSKQSFCYEDRKSVELFSTMTNSGLTFGFNLNGKVYDQST
jgi:hypothetical protein